MVVSVWGPELRDEAVVLRPLQAEDAEAHWAGEDEEQVKAFEFPGPAPLGNVVDAIERWQTSWACGGPVRNFGIWDRVSGALAGNVEVRDLGEGKVNISYLVFPGFRRLGLATRAVRLVLAYATEEMGASVAEFRMLADNLASVRVARAVGAKEVRSTTSDTGRPMVVAHLPLDRLWGDASAQPRR